MGASSDGETRDPVTEALKMIEQLHAAVLKVRTQVQDTERLLGELARISTVFDSVGDRLVNATFKASGDATRGVPSHAVLVSFVEELGDLARLALGGARDVRRELRARAAKPGLPPTSAFQETDLALQELASALRRLALRPQRPPATSIEIENRTMPPPPPRAPSPLERALAAGIFAASQSKSGGYKN
ncbi:MAG TPA: hypothetical protein VFH68_01630 [Polyangia bacterium]|nr:hypothetical protein [Polyangia bacterium]